MQQTIESRESPSQQTSPQLPAILSDAELQWLGDHNESLTIDSIIRRPGRPEETTTGRILTFPELPGLETKPELRRRSRRCLRQEGSP